MKIKKFTFENYKAFKFRQELSIRPITLIIGKNSSGKSVVSRLPLLLANSLSSSEISPIKLDFDGLKFGEEFRDLIYNRFEHGTVSFGVSFEGEKNSIELEITVQAIAGTPFHIISHFLLKSNGGFAFELSWDRDQSSELPASQVYHIHGNLEDQAIVEFQGILPDKILAVKDKREIVLSELAFLTQEIRQTMQNIEYIGPFRDLPKSKYKYSGKKPAHIHDTGQQAYQILGIDALSTRRIVDFVGSWYAENLGGWKLDIIPSGEEFKIVLTSPDDPNIKINLTNVGSGMSQVLPLVVRNFLEGEAREGLDILEQPELHLHPAAHGNLAELFVKTVKREKRSYIIETHSENILLRIRRLIANGDIDCQDVIIYWVDDEERPGSRLKPIYINQEGELDDWPKGVFSEDYEELIAIREAQRRKKEGL